DGFPDLATMAYLAADGVTLSKQPLFRAFAEFGVADSLGYAFFHIRRIYGVRRRVVTTALRHGEQTFPVKRNAWLLAFVDFTGLVPVVVVKHHGPRRVIAAGHPFMVFRITGLGRRQCRHAKCQDDQQQTIKGASSPDAG